MRVGANELTQIKCYPKRVLGVVENISLPHGKMLPEIGGNEVEKHQSRRAVGEIETALCRPWSRGQKPDFGRAVRAVWVSPQARHSAPQWSCCAPQSIARSAAAVRADHRVGGAD